MTTRWARFIRGQVVAVFATFAAAFSHGVADGGHPPVTAMVLALAFSSVACVVLAAARLSRFRLAMSVTVSQALYHGLFTLFGTAGQSMGAVSSGHHGTVVFSPGAVGSATAFAADPGMFIAHAVAAVATFAVLLRGEHAVAAIGFLARLIGAALSWWNLPQPRPAGFEPVAPTGHRTEATHRSLILTSSLSHRGPPAPPSFA